MIRGSYTPEKNKLPPPPKKRRRVSRPCASIGCATARKAIGQLLSASDVLLEKEEWDELRKWHNASVSIFGDEPEYAPRRCSALSLAEQFHATYERLAPEYGYETRPETRVFDPASANGKLMIAVSQSIINATGERTLPAGEKL